MKILLKLSHFADRLLLCCIEHLFNGKGWHQLDEFSNKMFQRNLRRLREYSNLTQNELADELFLARTSVSNYENGNREPTLSRLQQIASFFDVSVSYLIGDSNVDEESEEINDNKVTLSKHIFRKKYLDISELSTINKIILIEYFKFLIAQQRTRDKLKRKFK